MHSYTTSNAQYRVNKRVCNSLRKLSVLTLGSLRLLIIIGRLLAVSAFFLHLALLLTLRIFTTEGTNNNINNHDVYLCVYFLNTKIKIIIYIAP